jgi:DNA (cytosine-5)-methyltransferase 1
MKRGNTVGVRDQVMDLVAAQGERVSRVSVPTPTATDGFWDRDKVQRKVTAGSMNRGVDLPLWAKRINEGAYLLPTPDTMDDLPPRDESKIDRSKGGFSNVRETVVRPNFDRFEPVVRRWEQVTGMEAPAPTKPDGKDGAHRLSSKFTEWMMGLEPGWVTGHGLSRKDELKACGNGVVPQQAELALRLLLEVDDV